MRCMKRKNKSCSRATGFQKKCPTWKSGLRSRFEWGLIADLQSPDVETRIAILRKKSDDEGVALPEEVIQFLSATMKNNIRELEGSLVRLGAYASLDRPDDYPGYGKERPA